MDYSDYDKYFEEKGIMHYEKDGAMNKKLWESATIKILFVLKETAGYDNCPVFFLKDAIEKEWLPDKNRTYTKIAKLALFLQKSFDKKSSLTKEECKKLDKNHDILFKALEHCAVINIKKTSNKIMRSNKNVILKNFNEHADFLQQQIDSLSPNIVIAGSTDCWRCLSKSDNGLYRKIIKNEKLNKHECKKIGNIVFYHANHPSAWAYGGFNVVNIHKQIYDTLNGN